MLHSFVLVSAVVAAQSYMNGSAEVSYVDYSAEAEGKNLFSGDSLSQKYSIDWMSTNLYFRNQPRYYTVNLGYDWTSFTTSTNDRGTQAELSQTYGKLRYNGEIGFNPVGQPIRFKAYASNGEAARFKKDIYQGLINDNLTASISGMAKGYVVGFSFAYESDRAYSAAMRQLPRLYLDYRELVNKPVVNGSDLDDKTSELSVAGLNKENNWLKFRSTKYENFRNPYENYDQHQIQIGLVDNLGRRKWAALTNWINVSTDGSYTSQKMTYSGDFTEEYDVNFYAIATRRNWEARTLMNYNRLLDVDSITDNARIPVYVKGIWNANTDWYVNVAANRGRDVNLSGRVDTSYSNNLSFGATMFKRSLFNLSPSVSLRTSKEFRGGDAYEVDAGVDTSSSRYYSSKSNLSAGYHVKFKDDGTNTADSTSWSNVLSVKAQYAPTARLSLLVREELEYGKGRGYLNPSKLDTLTAIQGNQKYAQAATYASLRYVFSSALYTTLTGTHNYLKSADAQAVSWYNLSHSISYTRNDMSYALTTTYDKDDYSSRLNSGIQMQYRPNRYHDASLSGSYERNTFDGNDTEYYKLKQIYVHNIFSRKGTMRNIAALSEELSIIRNAVDSIVSTDSKYLLLSGRYSPMERLSLYASVKYSHELNGMTMFYNAGAAMDFKLLTTSLDYYLAKREIDNRIERRLSASVKRSF